MNGSLIREAAAAEQKYYSKKTANYMGWKVQDCQGAYLQKRMHNRLKADVALGLLITYPSFIQSSIQGSLI
jgi:hypothetical protein